MVNVVGVTNRLINSYALDITKKNDVYLFLNTIDRFPFITQRQFSVNMT